MVSRTISSGARARASVARRALRTGSHLAAIRARNAASRSQDRAYRRSYGGIASAAARAARLRIARRRQARLRSRIRAATRIQSAVRGSRVRRQYRRLRRNLG